MDEQEKVKDLTEKLEALIFRHKAYTDEIRNLRDELNTLRSAPKIERPLSCETPKKAPQEAPLSQSSPLEISEKTLKRNRSNKVLAGVSSGLADYLGMNVALVRLLVFASFFFYGLGLLVYVILWVVLPSRKSNQAFIAPVFHPKEEESDVKSSENSIPDQRSESVQNSSSLNLEKFIGEKIISIVGIAITIIGVAIGVKYSIEHDLISPTTRIIIAYLVGVALLGVGIYLKARYETFSAVLLSGAMAIFYFITFAAFSFYALFPREIAFVLMFVFTVSTVFSALKYNQQIIALIGLVGAYAVPYLLSDGSGKIEIMFTYMTIINIGILVIAFKRSWKLLYYSSFGLSWLIYFTWFNSKYESSYFLLASGFLVVFFVTFYIVFLAYKQLEKEEFDFQEVILLLLNTFFFFGIGYRIIETQPGGDDYLGLFTIGNAIVPFLAGTFVYRKQASDKNMLFLLYGLALLFVTIAVPVQLDGNWITILWSFEALVLFWIGRSKKADLYEVLALPVLFVAFYSLVYNWASNYSFRVDSSLLHTFSAHSGFNKQLEFLLNSTFLTSLSFLAALSFILWVDIKNRASSAFEKFAGLQNLVTSVLAITLIGVAYFSIRLEIAQHFNQLFAASKTVITGPEGYEEAIFNNEILLFKIVWQFIFGFLFMLILSLLNQFKLKSNKIAVPNIGANALVILAFLVEGLFALSELRDTYLDVSDPLNYSLTGFHIGIRYVSIAFFVALLWASTNYIKRPFLNFTKQLKLNLDGLVHLSILWLASSEFINIMTLAGAHAQYKLGLSILWGVYALLLISLGIWKRKAHLRIGAIALFAVTLIKLFFYDISHLSTISKTIIFVSLGLLLLIISFLYNKFKSNINDEV